jgi:hypothetical protein
MATYSSKQEKSQVLVDPLFVLVSVMVIVTLMIFGPLKINIYSPVHNAVQDLSPSPVASFSADKQYWDARCSHGWNDDSTCENIVMRTQACYIGVAELSSAYCTQYDAYLKGLQHKPSATAYYIVPHN